MIVNLFFLLYSIANVGLILYGILVLIKPGVLLESFSLYVYQFPEQATTARTYLEALYRLLGYFNFVLGLLGVLLLVRIRISRQTWIARIVIISTILAYLGPVMFDNTVGNIGFFEIVEHILFGLVIILGVLMWGGWDETRGFRQPQSPKNSVHDGGKKQSTD